MNVTTKWWLAVPLTAGLALAGCGGDDETTEPPDASGAPASTTAAEADATDPAGADAASEADDAGSPVAAIMLGDEEIAMASLRCYFEEQPRAGLGGVFTHTAQGRGTNAAGEQVLLDLSRARDEDGTVGDDVIVDIGEPAEAVSLSAQGPEGLIQFGDASAAVDGVEVSEFGAEPVTLSFDIPCG